MELDSHLSTAAAFSWALVPHVHSAYHSTAFFFLTTCQTEKQTTNKTNVCESAHAASVRQENVSAEISFQHALVKNNGALYVCQLPTQ